MEMRNAFKVENTMPIWNVFLRLKTLWKYEIFFKGENTMEVWNILL